jgi:hypothetical protein
LVTKVETRRHQQIMEMTEEKTGFREMLETIDSPEDEDA